MSAITVASDSQDHFAKLFGAKRGSDRPDDENDKYISSLVRERAEAASLAEHSSRNFWMLTCAFVFIMAVFCTALAADIYYTISIIESMLR